jgi:hypothetical protein
MINVLKRAMAKVSTLPEAAQEKIGAELLLHVTKVDRLRAELDKGLRSLDQGQGHEIDVDNLIRRARAQYGEK